MVWLVEQQDKRATVWCFHLMSAETEARQREDPENFRGELLITLASKSFPARNPDTGEMEQRSILAVEHVESLELGPPLDLDAMDRQSEQEERDGEYSE